MFLVTWYKTLTAPRAKLLDDIRRSGDLYLGAITGEQNDNLVARIFGFPRFSRFEMKKIISDVLRSEEKRNCGNPLEPEPKEK